MKKEEQETAINQIMGQKMWSFSNIRGQIVEEYFSFWCMYSIFFICGDLAKNLQ